MATLILRREGFRPDGRKPEDAEGARADAFASGHRVPGSYGTADWRRAGRKYH
jgi:hypothetical protein